MLIMNKITDTEKSTGNVTHTFHSPLTTKLKQSHQYHQTLSVEYDLYV